MIRLAAALLLLFAGASGAVAATNYDQAFVDAFAEACVPGRLSYVATQEVAAAAGWVEVEADHHPELAAMLAIAAAALANPEPKIDNEQKIYARDVEGTGHHLVVTRTSVVLEEGDSPWVLVGCHLYNFDAKVPIAPGPVTAFTGNPIGREINDSGMIGYLWGPPCPLPRTGDTYLTYIAEESPHVAQTGFSGLTMKFDTSEPDPGEEVPETYC